MQDRAVEAGLALSPVAPGDENYKGPSTDSYSLFLDGVYARSHPRHLRPLLRSAFGNEVVDQSVDRRRRDASLAYRPTNAGLPVLSA
jgi:hypothetical protein